MTDRANRALWIIVGLLLAAAGGLGVLAHIGRLRFLSPDDPVVPESVVELWRRGGQWSTAVPVVAGLLLLWLGFLLFRKEFRRRGTTRIEDLFHPGEKGHTVVRAAGLIHGLERDVSRGPGIAKASATITGRTDSPRVWLRVGLAPGATVDQAREHVRGALERLTATSGLDASAVDVTVLPTAKATARVR